MSAAAHILVILFAAPAGSLAYLVLTVPDSPRLGLHHLLAVVLLFVIPLVGIPEAAGTTVLAFLAACGVTRTGYRRWQRVRNRRRQQYYQRQHQRRQRQQTGSQQSTQRHPPRTGPHGEPIVFKDQLRDD